MKDLFLTNTITRKKERFVPISQDCVLVYTCGPTVYDFAHIGNFRTFICEDVLLRVLRCIGYSVNHVMNITDVDDKTIKGSINKGVSLKSFTKEFTLSFFEDLENLRISKASFYPLATDFIPEMINMISTLEEKGFAYKANDGSVYFSIKKFNSYGSLSNTKISEESVSRVDNDEYLQESCADFVLWKLFDPKRDGDVFWESPWGKGRPGWHIECSAMCESKLGKTIDIHAGGIDNLFPHHENEIAQSTCCFNCKLANFWIHVEHLMVDGKKMSKSENNFHTVRSLLDSGFDPLQIRYFLMQNHYRMPLNFTIDGLNAAASSINRIRSCFYRLMDIDNDDGCLDFLYLANDFKDQFWNAMCDDLNTPVALSVIFESVKQINILIDQEKICKNVAEAFINMFEEFDSILQVLHFDGVDINVEKNAYEMLEQRKIARSIKDWQKSDFLRKEIEKLGFSVEDKKERSFIRRQ